MSIWFDESGKGWQCPLSEFATFAISALAVLQTGMEPRKRQRTVGALVRGRASSCWQASAALVSL